MGPLTQIKTSHVNKACMIQMKTEAELPWNEIITYPQNWLYCLQRVSEGGGNCFGYCTNDKSI